MSRNEDYRMYDEQKSIKDIENLESIKNLSHAQLDRINSFNNSSNTVHVDANPESEYHLIIYFKQKWKNNINNNVITKQNKKDVKKQMGRTRTITAPTSMGRDVFDYGDVNLVTKISNKNLYFDRSISLDSTQVQIYCWEMFSLF